MKINIACSIKPRLMLKRGKTSLAVLAAMLTGWSSVAEPAKTLDLDFSRAQTGCLPNKVAPDQPPAVIDTYSVYGRLRGESAILDDGVRVAGAALGRNGDLSALRLGSSEDGIVNLGPRLQTGQPFALEMWVSVYDAQKYFNGLFLYNIHGYKQGFRLEFNKQKWSPNGWLNLTWGTKTGSDHIHVKTFLPELWHQIVMSYDSKSMALYVDGELAEQKPAFIDFTAKGGELLVGKKWQKNSISLDYKLDQLTLYSGALSADEVKAHFAQGTPAATATADREAQLTALKLEIPHDSYGYFRTGQQIPVLLDAESAADELRVNGATHALPLKSPVALSFPEPGLQGIKLALLAKGRVLKEVEYPVAIVPFESVSSKLGAGELASQQPEVCALGLKLSRVVIDWAQLEPQKHEYDWKGLDAIMERNQELGVESILCLTGRPRWLKLAANSANLPADMALYQKIWRLLANRYDGVTYFEVWNCNNPNRGLQGDESSKFSDYAVLLRAAAEAVRQDLPEAKILAGRIDIGDGLGLAAYLQKNAADYYDIFSGKHYSVEPAKRYARSPWSAKIRKATSKPVWNTACGIQQFARTTLLPPENSSMQMQKSWPIPTVDEWTAATWQIQDLALQLADGIERVILESGPSQYGPGKNATTGQPGVKGLALAVFNGLVGKDATLARLPQTPAGVFAIRFENPGGRKGLILFTSGNTAAVRLPAESSSAQLIDLLGKQLPLNPAALTIGEQPVYLLNVQTINQ
jgi:hypothetical protein